MKLDLRTTCSALVLVVTSITQSAIAADALSESAAYQKAAQSRTDENPKLVWTASSVALLAEEVAPKVFAVYPDTAAEKNTAGAPEATSAGFVIGNNGVLVVDTLINRNLAEQFMALIREQTDQPIRYIVNTSYHGDHSYGNQFFPKDAVIIQHQATQTYIQSHFAKDIAFMEQYFGTDQGLDELQPIAADVLLEDGADITIDLGGIAVRIRHLGFAQTEGDLFISAADDKVVFTGNPVIAKAPALPWLLDGHLQASTETMKALRGLLADDAIVVPGHGAPTNIAAIEHHINYLEDLKRQVATAIVAGKTKEEVVEILSMPEYAGYKLHPWVHIQVNLPAAYDELKSE